MKVPGLSMFVEYKINIRTSYRISNYLLVKSFFRFNAIAVTNRTTVRTSERCIIVLPNAANDIVFSTAVSFISVYE